MPGTRNVGLICPQNLFSVVVRRIYQDGVDVRDVLRKETYPDWITPVHAFLSYWQHPLTHTSSPRAGMLPRSYSSCVLFPYNICKSQASPAHLPRAPSSRLPWAQVPPPGTLAEGPCISPIPCPFLCSPSCLILSISHFHSKISNSLSVAQKPSMAYHQLKVCVLELAFQMSSHLSLAPPTSVFRCDPVSVEWQTLLDGWMDGWMDSLCSKVDVYQLILFSEKGLTLSYLYAFFSIKIPLFWVHIHIGLV